MNFGNRLNIRPVDMPMMEPDPSLPPPVPMPMMEPDPNAPPPVPMPQIDPRGMMDMTEEDIQNIVEMFKQYMNKSPQIGVPEGQGQQSLEDIIGRAVMESMGGQ